MSAPAALPPEMAAPPQQPVGPGPEGAPPQPPAAMLPGVSLDELISTLGNAAEKSAQKGAATQDPDAAKGFGQAALAFTQALMAVLAPHVPPQGGGSAPGSNQQRT